MARGEVRARMVGATVRLLAENGPPGASLRDVLESAQAPRGSTYHHFPGGKRETLPGGARPRQQSGPRRA